MTWQPMETCPKDGKTVVDLWVVPLDDNPNPAQRFTDQLWATNDGWLSVNLGEGWYFDPQWWRAAYWMPLPAPPETEER